MACRTGSRSHSWLGRHGLDDRGLVGGVLHHAHAEQEGLLRHDELRGLGQQLAEDIHAVGVQLGGAGDLAHADGHHLDDAALDGRTEVGMRLDPAHEGDRVGSSRELVHVDRHAVDLAQLHHFHLRLDRAADIALGDAVVLQHLALAFGRGAAVAAHGGEDEGLGAEGLELGHHLLHALGDVGDAAAAHTERNGHAGLHGAAHLGPLELLHYRLADVVDPGGFEFLPDMDHAGQRDIQPARNVHFDAIADHVLLRAGGGSLRKVGYFTP